LIEHIWSVLCESGAVDIESGHVSMFNSLEGLKISGEPDRVRRIPLQFEVFSLWARSAPDTGAKGNMRIVFCLPDGEQKAQIGLPIDLTEGFFQHTRIHANGLNVKGAGIYKFIIELQEEGTEDWKSVATIPLLVVFEPPTPPQK
jgi:hypothetical protein